MSQEEANSSSLLETLKINPSKPFSITASQREYPVTFDYKVRQKVYDEHREIDGLDYDIPSSEGLNVIESEERLRLTNILRKLRNKKIKTEEEIKLTDPGIRLPAFWQKKLTIISDKANSYSRQFMLK